MAEAAPPPGTVVDGDPFLISLSTPFKEPVQERQREVGEEEPGLGAGEERTATAAGQVSPALVLLFPAARGARIASPGRERSTSRLALGATRQDPSVGETAVLLIGVVMVQNDRAPPLFF